MQNVAVIGLGKMGMIHAGIVKSMPDVQLKAICEKNTLLLRLAKKFLPKTVALYKDPVEMARKEELDAAFITTPIGTHVPIALDLMHSNPSLSIFLEKPLASSYQQAKMACKAARKMQGCHMVGYQRRFSPIIMQAKKFVEEGALGDLMFFKAHCYSAAVLTQGAGWRLKSGGGGVLLDLGSHLLDMLLWFFGEPSSVAAVKRPLYSREVDDYVHAILSFKSGLTGHMDTCWSLRDFRLSEYAIEVHGTDGSFLVTDDYVKVQLHKDGMGGSQTYFKQNFDTSVSFLLSEPELTLEDEAFLSALAKSSLPELNFFEAAKVNAIIDLIEKSGTSQEVISVEEPAAG